MAASARNRGTLAVPASQQGERGTPVLRGTVIVKSPSLPNTKRVCDLVESSAFCLVGSVGAEAQVAVVVCFCGGDTGSVVDSDGLGNVGCQSLVAGYGCGHGSFDTAVCCGLVC